MKRYQLHGLLLGISLGYAAQAVEPTEVLSDPALESRAREISQHLRCLVCQNETIDESNSPLASDLRVLVREQLIGGKTDDEVYRYVTDRYGEFVLLQPRMNGSNLVLYLSGPLLLCFALIAMGMYVIRRHQKRQLESAPLTSEEKDKLKVIAADNLATDQH